MFWNIFKRKPKLPALSSQEYAEYTDLVYLARTSKEPLGLDIKNRNLFLKYRDVILKRNLSKELKTQLKEIDLIVKRKMLPE